MSNKNNTRAYEITMVVRAAPDATVETVRSLIYDLEWVGGCRDPETDPGFDSLKVVSAKISRAPARDVRGK